MNVQGIYELVNFLADKYQSRQISDDEFNIAMAAANLDLWKVKVGAPEEYKVNIPFSAQAWQVSNKISDDMRKFIVKVNVTKNANSIFAYPSDYGAFSSIRYKKVQNSTGCAEPRVYNRTVELVTDSELSERLDNTIVFPDLDYPIAAYYDTGFQVFPKEISRVELTYLRIPVTPFRNYTLNTTTLITTYNPVGSVQLEFPETLHIDFAARVCRYLAINIRDGELMNDIMVRQNAGS